MSENRPRNMIPFGGSMLTEFVNRVKLILRLMGDSRVSPWIKLIPVGSLVYLLFPDLLPSPIDDAAIIWLSTVMFVELCPPDVVKEHQDDISGVVPPRAQDLAAHPAPPAEEDVVEGEIIEGEFKDAE